MKTRLLIIIGIIALVSIVLISSVIIDYQIPRYATTANGQSYDELLCEKTNPHGCCDKTISHGFFSEYPVSEEIILNEIKNPDSRLKLEFTSSQMDEFREFMIESFGSPNPNCFYYEYNNSTYPLHLITGPASYFTHSFYPDQISNLPDRQLMEVLELCEYQKDMDERDGIVDEREITREDTLTFWSNTTHYIDNNICEFTERK